MKILISDNRQRVRSAVGLLLEQQETCQVIEQAGNFYALLQSLAAGCPDLILLDWELEGFHPQKISLLYNRCPQARIIALSSQPESRSKALAAGVDGFVTKGDPPRKLLAAVAAAAEKDPHLEWTALSSCSERAKYSKSKGKKKSCSGNQTP